MRDGLPNDEIFSIREARNGDLLIGARGMVRMRNGRFTTYLPPDPVARFNVFDVMEDSGGRIWLATPGGLGGAARRSVSHRGAWRARFWPVAFVTLCEGRDGAIWAGTHGKGLWRVQGDEVRLFTTADGSGERPDSIALRGSGWDHLDRNLRRRIERVSRRKLHCASRRRTACSATTWRTSRMTANRSG